MIPEEPHSTFRDRPFFFISARRTQGQGGNRTVWKDSQMQKATSGAGIARETGFLLAQVQRLWWGRDRASKTFKA
jgi:hypothetical protein